MDGVRITCVRRVEEGDRSWWEARVTPAGGSTFTVWNRYGSWSTMPTTRNPVERPVSVALASALQVRQRQEASRLTSQTEAA